MIINDLNLKSIAIFPNEADSPLIIDSNTVLSKPVALQLLQPIRWRNPQRVQTTACRENFELSSGKALNIPW